MSRNKRPTVATLYRQEPSKTALLTYERAVNDNIPAKQLRDVAKNRQCKVGEHLTALAAELVENRGW